MSDEQLDPREPLIDVRSPAERWSDAGRARYGSLQTAVDRGRLDVAALVWMAIVLLLVALQVYLALRGTIGFGRIGWWDKATIIAESGGLLVIFGSMIGIALAAFSRGNRRQLALRLAMIGGAWGAAASMLGIATAVHNPIAPNPIGEITRSGELKAVQALSYFGYSALGLVVAVVAWHVLRAHVDRSELDDGPLGGALPVS